MSRQSYVQHPQTGKLVKKEEVTWRREKFRGVKADFIIMDDIEPFVSPIDQTVITSRSHLREHNKRHDVVNYHEFDGLWEEKEKERKQILEGTHAPTKRQRAQDIKESWEKVEQGYKPQVGNEDDPL